MVDKEYLDYERSYAYLGEQGVSIAMDVECDGAIAGYKWVTLAMAVCKKSDTFRKSLAKRILDGRLNIAGYDHSNVPLTCQFGYTGDKPRNDIFNKLIRGVRHCTYITHYIARRDGSSLVGQIVREDGNIVAIDTGRDIVAVEQSDIISRKLINSRRSVD
ncbi:unnamed protein product, partial [marine sediment metagenome]